MPKIIKIYICGKCSTNFSVVKSNKRDFYKTEICPRCSNDGCVFLYYIDEIGNHILV
jgi:DNA-directed RNA polymerase subunit RPC12/RpoP